MTTAPLKLDEGIALLAANRVLKRTSEGSIQPPLTKGQAMALRALIWDLKAELGRASAQLERIKKQGGERSAEHVQQVVDQAMGEELRAVAAEQRETIARSHIRAIVSALEAQTNGNSTVLHGHIRVARDWLRSLP